MADGLAFITINASVNPTRLRIPTAFVDRIQTMKKKVTIRDCSGKCWKLEVVQRNGQWFFEKGWVKFHEQNSLQPGDFLVFEYKGANVFDFKLLGKSVCEKNRADDVLHKAKERETIILEEEEEIEQDKESDDVDDDEDYVEESNEEDEDEDYVEESNEEDEDEEVEIRPKFKKTKKKPRISGPNCSSYGAGDLPRKQEVCRKPKNSSFISKSRAENRPNALNIPKHNFLHYNGIIPKNVFLVDEGGRKYATTIKEWGDGRWWCSSKAWRALCKVNGIQRDDSCFCELQQTSDTLYIHVRPLEG